MKRSSLQVPFLAVILLGSLKFNHGQTNRSSHEKLTTVTYASGFPVPKQMVWAVHVTPPFAMYDPTKTGRDAFSGFVPDMATMLESNLNVNFTMVLGHPPNPVLEDETLELLKFDGDDGRSYADIAGGAIHVSANRSLAVRFSTPYFQSGFRLVVPLPKPTHDPLSFGSPFDDLLWLCVGIEIFIVAVTVYFMEAPARTFAEETDLHEGPIEGFLDSLYMSCTFMLGTADKAPKTWGGKITLLAHGWFMLIIVASYTANLASFLVATQIAPAVAGWADITGSNGGLSLALPRDSAQMSFLSWEEHHYKYKFNVTWTATMQEAYDMVAAGQADATFEDEAIVQYYLLNTRPSQPPTAQNPDPACDLMAVGRPFHDVAYALAFDLANLDFIPFSESIVFLREVGEISKLSTKYNLGAGGLAAEDAAVAACAGGAGSGVLIVEDMTGLLGLVAGILGLAFIVHGAERWQEAKKKDKVTPEEEGKGDAASGPEGAGSAAAGAAAVVPVRAVGGADAALQAAIEAGVRAGVERFQASGGGAGSAGDAEGEKAGMS